MVVNFFRKKSAPSEKSLATPVFTDVTIYLLTYRAQNAAAITNESVLRDLPESERVASNQCFLISESVITHRAPDTVMKHFQTTC